MEAVLLIELLRTSNCDGCPYGGECIDSQRGCVLSLKAADLLELAAAERQAVFALGQMDMRQSAQQALADAAAGGLGIIAATYRQAAVIVGDLEIS